MALWVIFDYEGNIMVVTLKVHYGPLHDRSDNQLECEDEQKVAGHGGSRSSWAQSMLYIYALLAHVNINECGPVFEYRHTHHNACTVFTDGCTRGKGIFMQIYASTLRPVNSRKLCIFPKLIYVHLQTKLFHGDFFLLISYSTNSV